MFGLLKKWRRRRILGRPFDPRWLEYLARHVPHYDLLTGVEQAKLRDDLRIFIAERHWEGVGGLAITDEVQVAIAGQACLLVLSYSVDLFDRVRTVLVKPDAYVGPETIPVIHDIALFGETVRLGEAHYRGPVILSWKAAQRGGALADEGENLVMHEFAHQLDMLDGLADGIPPIGDPALRKRWKSVMQDEYERLARAAERGRETILDPYGATDEAEFFSVATESFFQRPVDLRTHQPRLYTLLCAMYQQDPASRMGAPARPT
jgi:Mlc titration factor MtfA (ptsG expression regulator)